MFKNLLDLYPGSFITNTKPIDEGGLRIFYNEAAREWISIPADAISEKELTLLSSLYIAVDSTPEDLSPELKRWKDFLFANGKTPEQGGGLARLIQFHFYGTSLDREELETAIKGFFPGDVLIIWNDPASALVVERGSFPLDEKDIALMPEALESDFYIKTAIYIGRQMPVSTILAEHFRKERHLFDFAKRSMGTGDYFTYERIFPAYLAAHITENLAEGLYREFSDAFSSDEEMFTTVKGFLESGSNASLASKKLYIHRNTLQYRIDKFTDRTGVSLKDFHSAFTVYLACLLHERMKKDQ